MDKLDKAFQKFHRQDFVPDEIRNQVNFDMALPIGYGQTISQPTTVKWMLEWLELQPGDKILDIGSGSGWTTALLSYLVGPKGWVYAVERIPELLEFGKNNCLNTEVINAKFFLAGKEYGLPRYAPYNRILVSAAAQKLPVNLLDQLSIDGKLVIPVKNDILEITKLSKNNYETITHPGFVFVPLI
jgi:protein-L-isoaspartate(D-aspartate) O-methyltransferase